jgi:hypothetical protein
MWKNSSDYLVKFKIFKYLKFNKKCFKKYIYSIIKILNYFSHILSQMFQWTAKFQIQMLYRLRDTKKEKLFERAKKRLARILMHLLTVQIEGTAEITLKKSTLLLEKFCLTFPSALAAADGITDSFVGPSDLGEHVWLSPSWQGRGLLAPWWCGGLELHYLVHPIVKAERRSAQPLHRHQGLTLFLSTVQPRVAKACFLSESWGRWMCWGQNHAWSWRREHMQALSPSWGRRHDTTRAGPPQASGQTLYLARRIVTEAPRCRPLLEGIVLVTCGVPKSAIWSLGWRLLWAWTWATQCTSLAALLTRCLLLDGLVPPVTRRPFDT